MVSVNEVLAKGKIIATGKDRRGYSTITIVIRGKRPAIVRFVVDNLPSSIGMGDYVRVKGHTKAYSYYDDIQNKWTSVQYFVADELEKCQTELMEKFGVEGHYFGDASFRAYFAGEVTNTMETNENWGKITVKVNGVGVDKRLSYVTLSYLRSYRLPEFKYERGDQVYISASINTPQKEFDGRTVNFENLIVEDIVKNPESEKTAEEEQKNDMTDVM